MDSQETGSGRFITIEGIEGVGKSTNVDFIANFLRKSGKQVIETREPGGTPVAEKIRDILLNSRPDELSGISELLLMFAARASHLNDLVIPAINRGKWVVSDRFTDATYAYQGGGREMELTTISQLKHLVQGPLTPDLTILLDAPPELTVERRQKRGTTDRFETEDLAFFTRVRNGYLAIAEAEPERLKVIDATVALPQVQSQIEAVLKTYI